MSKRKYSGPSTPPPPGHRERHWSSRSTPMNLPTDEDFEEMLELLQQPETPSGSLNMTYARPGELLSFSPILPDPAATAAPLEAVAAATPRGVAYREGRNHGKSIIATHQTHHSTSLSSISFYELSHSSCFIRSRNGGIPSRIHPRPSCVRVWLICFTGKQ